MGEKAGPIKAPQPSKPPVPPKPPPPVSPDGLARELYAQRRLPAKKQDQARIEEIEKRILALKPVELLDLEARLTKDLSATDIRNFGYELRSLYRFARAKTPYTPKDRSAPSLVKGSIKATFEKALGASEKVVLKQFEDGAYHLELHGDTTDAFWLQFIWRNIHGTLQSKRTFVLQDRVSRGGRRYLYTSNPGDPGDAKSKVAVKAKPGAPRWTIDGMDPAAPWYETKTPASRAPNLLVIADQPSSNDFELRHLFDGTDKPTQCTSIFHAETYLVRRNQVLARADIHFFWTFDKIGGSQPVTWRPPSVSVANGIRPGPRAALALQFPDFDYFLTEPKTELLAKPVPLDDFEPLPASSVQAAQWPSGADPMPKLVEATNLASAKLIIDVEEHEMTQVLTIHKHDIKPGLVLRPTISNDGVSAGITAYVDAAGKDSAAIPTERHGALPQVAMQMGSLAFVDKAQKERDRIFTLSVLRHEMAHAASNRTSIGWLLRWRDDLTKLGFIDWLKKLNIPKDIEGADYARARTYLDGQLKHATEAIGFTEGMVTALPFLTGVPDVTTLHKKSQWPAFLSELEGLLKQLKTLDAIDGGKGTLAKIDTRLTWCLCEMLDDTQRETFIKWAKFLAEIDKAPKPADPAITLTELQGAFSGGKAFIEKMIKLANSCPKPKKR